MADDDLATLVSALDVEPTRGNDRAATGSTVLSVSCTLGDCDHDPAWLTEAPVDHVGVTTLGPRTWEQQNGERVLSASIRRLIADRPVAAIVVVGHTDCDVVADAYDHAHDATASAAAGIQATLAPLATMVDEATAAGVVGPEDSPRQARQRLAEYNVVRNVAFLRSQFPAMTVAGVVTDRAGVYGSFPGKQYLVALDDAAEPTALRARLPDDAQLSVGCQLSPASTR